MKMKTMTMTMTRPVLLAGWALLAAGCSSVLLKEPFPESKLTGEERAGLAGAWRLGKEVVHVAIDGEGNPWLAMLEWKDGDFLVRKYRLRFARHGGALYVSMPAQPAGEPDDGFFFAEVRLADEGILAWSPDPAYFARLVEEGTLGGSVRTDRQGRTTEVRLDNPAGEILAFVSTHAAAFDYRNPLVLQKIE